MNSRYAAPQLPEPERRAEQLVRPPVFAVPGDRRRGGDQIRDPGPVTIGGIRLSNDRSYGERRNRPSESERQQPAGTEHYHTG